MRDFVPAMLVAALLLASSDARAQSPLPPAFSGWYIGLGGAYGVGTQRDFDQAATVIFPGISSTSPLAFGNASPSGPSGIAIAGHNLAFGALIFGLEAQGRWGQERLARSSEPLPVFSLDAAGNFSQTGQFVGKYRFDNDIGAHLAARVGLAVNNTMVFAKAGVGIAHIVETASFEGAGSTCSGFVNSNFRNLCTSTRPIGSGAATDNRWMPSLILGVGVEQNFGNWFARIGAEAESVVGLQSSVGVKGVLTPGLPGETFVAGSSTPEPAWTVRANALIGLRF